MGERCNRTAEVRGSIPLSSTSQSACAGECGPRRKLGAFWNANPNRNGERSPRSPRSLDAVHGPSSGPRIGYFEAAPHADLIMRLEYETARDDAIRRFKAMIEGSTARDMGYFSVKLGDYVEAADFHQNR